MVVYHVVLLLWRFIARQNLCRCFLVIQPQLHMDASSFQEQGTTKTPIGLFATLSKNLKYVPFTLVTSKAILSPDLQASVSMI